MNESGMLWEGWWYKEDGKYYTEGTFASRQDFMDSKAFWKAFNTERRRFYGVKLAAPPQSEKEKQ